MNTLRTNITLRPLFITIVTVAVLWAVFAPTAQAGYLNYYRDYVCGLYAADWNDANVSANTGACAGGVNSTVPGTAAYSWAQSPITKIVQSCSTAGYDDWAILRRAGDGSAIGRIRNLGPDSLREWYHYDNGLVQLPSPRLPSTGRSYCYRGEAYFLLYYYYACSYPAYFEYFYDSGLVYYEQYLGIANDWENTAYKENSKVRLDWNTAFSTAGGPADAEDYVCKSFVKLYSTSWLDNSAYYCLEEATYNYNLWSYYGAPYYGICKWFAGVAKYYSAIASLRACSINANVPKYRPGGVGTPVDTAGKAQMVSDLKAATDSDIDLAEYWDAWGQYYRDLSDAYEG